MKKDHITVKKERDELSKSLKVIETDLKKTVKDIQPKKLQAAFKKMVEAIENKKLIQDDDGDEDLSDLKDELNELATELEVKCEEVQTYKINFERLQADCNDRTSELERLSSQLQKAKHDGNTAVEKLKKAEDNLGQIKEKNAQLSDELLNKSRQLAVLENSAPTPTSGKTTVELERQVEELKRQLADAAAGNGTAVAVAGGGARKKSVKFAVESEPVIAASPSTDLDSKIANLERALEDAAKEREEILEAAEKEIEYHRSIAADLEQSLIEDFEWKLHEIEADFHKKLHEHNGDKVPASKPISTSTLKSR
jgi:myosin heavy subunit